MTSSSAPLIPGAQACQWGDPAWAATHQHACSRLYQRRGAERYVAPQNRLIRIPQFHRRPTRYAKTLTTVLLRTYRSAPPRHNRYESLSGSPGTPGRERPV